MGVMLSLDQPGPARSRRQGQHVRDCDEPARVDTLAGMLRCDAAGAGRYLSRLAAAVLAGRLRPAPPALTGAALTGAALTGAAGTRAAGTAFATGRRARQVEIRLIVSVPCLLGQCRAAGDGPGCESSVCEHDCHRRESSPDGEQTVAATGA
jgi:hypothetical protein